MKKAKSIILIAFTVLMCFSCAVKPGFDGDVTRIDSPYSENKQEGRTQSGDETGSPSSDATEPIPPEPQTKRISFLAAGDNIIHGDVMLDAQNRAENNEGYNFLPMYEGIASLIGNADIAFVNQEGPLGVQSRPYSGYPNFNAPPQAGEALIDLGFDIVNIANNHMLDVKEAGLLESIAYWESKDILLLGAYKNADDYEDIRVYDYDGLKIAFLSYTYGTNGMTLNAGSKHIIPLISDADITRQTAKAKEIGDLVFVSIHWGVDYNEDSWPYGNPVFNPNAEQKRVAQLIADCGADVIIGTHPHVVQKMTWLEGKDGNKTLCVYSLGNMISTMHANYNMVGGFMTFDITVSPEGKIGIESPLFIPTVTHYLTNASTGTRYGLQLYLLEDYTEELVQKHGSQLRPGGKFTLDTLRSYITTNIDPEFLPDSFK